MRLLRLEFPIFAAVLSVGCVSDFGGPVFTAPEEPEVVDPGPPQEEAPTGSKWEVRDEEDACGRTRRTWVLVDEVCAGTRSRTYLDHFRAPMFRDGIRIGEVLYAVDGTQLWAMDADDYERFALTAVPGHPLALASHRDRLLVAAGDAGVLLLDVSDPARPRIIDQAHLEGPAMGARVDGDVAWIATGDEGFVALELTKSGFGQRSAVAGPPGDFVAAVEVREDTAFVAACDSFAVVDPVTDEVLGTTWFDESLEIPARDVTVVGGVAFVAAGREGVVSVDVSEPHNPRLIGSCRVNDEAYYASAVRTDGKHLYVAGGEWGVQVIDVRDPQTACTAVRRPEPSPATETCDTEPPWRVINWRQLWFPPAPAKDPIAVRIDGDRLFAFGDARRIGLRAVDVWDAAPTALETIDPTSNDWLSKLGRYEEPHLLDRIVANDTRVLAMGARAGLYERTAEGLVLAADQPLGIDSAQSATFLSDGRWMFVTSSGNVRVEGASRSLARELAQFSHDIVQEPSGDVVLSTEQGLLRLTLDGVTTSVEAPPTELPPSLAVSEGSVVVAAPEWPRAIALDDAEARELPSHGAFDEREIMDVARWRDGLPRRQLAASERGIVELATLGREGVLVLHLDRPSRLNLPAGTYAGLATRGTYAYAIAQDRSLYRSQLLVFDLSAEKPVLVQTIAFTGITTSLAVGGDRLYVADADDGIVVFDIATGRPAYVETVSLQEAP